MTVEQAKQIVATANLKTMTPACIAKYKQALAILANKWALV